METAVATESSHDDHFRTLTPPTSEDMDKDKEPEKKDDTSSELSELDDNDVDDIGDIEPDHYYDGGKIPVFKPTMDQFRSFKKFVDKIDHYGMKSGIVKVIPPQEWRSSLPDLSEAIKAIKVKNPISQEFAGTHGTYTQANIEKQRSYNLPQWKALTEETHHQPPAKRGERRRNQDTVTRTRSTRTRASSPLPPGEKRRPGRPRKKPLPKDREEEVQVDEASAATPQVPPTPASPGDQPPAETEIKEAPKTKVARLKAEDDTPTRARGRQPKAKSISSRRMNNRRDVADEVDEEAFKNFDYKFERLDEFTAERCRELEEVYWKTLNYGTPMYGADMPGSLFNDSCTVWNVAHLENLLDVLGTKVPGVNTAYLYLGMWKATFAWHLEDVDLYSINYIHFGAPKQWYSISQEDARRFEAAMKSIWPNDAKNCDQFLRHKTYLISPEKLKSQYNIRVNKLVHNEGEFVITYPYGYHSGFNLGYNCAESVNFATDAWLNYGRIAKKCDCEADSVWVDVSEIERKLRGEPTPEYYEETDDEDDEDDLPNDLPSPPASLAGKPKAQARKRKRNTNVKDAGPKTKRVKIRVKVPSKEPCILCPNDVSFDGLLPTDNGQKAHRLCALYTPETFLTDEKGVERVNNVAHIDRARLDLKCNFCRSKRGACFQCSAKKCTRAYHATCAAAAGVQIDAGPVPTWDENGVEYYCEGYDFRCRFHRAKRPKNASMESLEDSKLVRKYAKDLKSKDIVQAQYLSGEIFAGTVLENRPCEQSVLVNTLPDGDEMEIDWKYLLVLDPADSKRPKPSSSAQPLPEHLTNNKAVNAGNRTDAPPEMDDPFHDPNASQKWAEFNTCAAEEARNPHQVKVDMSKPNHVWHYLGKTSTEARPQYTHDPKITTHNPKSNFLDTVKPPPKPVVSIPRQSYPATYPAAQPRLSQATKPVMATPRPVQAASKHREYQYKPKNMPHANLDPRTYYYTLDGQRHAASSPSTTQPSPTSSGTHGYTAAHQYYSSGNSRAGSHERRPSDHTNGVHLYQTPGLPNQHPPQTPRPVDSYAQQPRQSYAASYPTWSQAPRSSYIGNVPANGTPPVGSPTLWRAPSIPSVSRSPAIPSTPETMSNAEYLQKLEDYPYLRASYLRRPKCYVSPYAKEGGFTPEWMTKQRNAVPVISSAAHLSQSTPTSRRPSLQFQTPQQFQQQMNLEQSKPAVPTKFQALMAQLKSMGEKNSAHTSHIDPRMTMQGYAQDQAPTQATPVYGGSYGNHYPFDPTRESVTLPPNPYGPQPPPPSPYHATHAYPESLRQHHYTFGPSTSTYPTPVSNSSASNPSNMPTPPGSRGAPIANMVSPPSLANRAPQAHMQAYTPMQPQPPLETAHKRSPTSPEYSPLSDAQGPAHSPAMQGGLSVGQAVPPSPAQ